VNTVAIIGRMLLALVLVLGVMWALARWARKPMGVGKGERVMTVLARQQLSRTSSVAVLKLMDRAFVLGVTEQGVQLITETELAPIEEALTVQAAPRRKSAALSSAALSLDTAPDTSPDVEDSAAVARVSPSGLSLAGRSRLDGSVLSPATWKQLVSAARELTVRR
jgi:flagellar protein FliO/FliZ